MEPIRHIISIDDFDRMTLDHIFGRAAHFNLLLNSEGGERKLRAYHPDRTLAQFFYEPSTRTKFSTIQAAHLLGMRVAGTDFAGEFSSEVKGETFEDSIRTLCALRYHMIALRHKEAGAARRAALVSSVPIINCGDGGAEHPTQAFLDAFTINRSRGQIDGVKLAIIGDNKNSRTARSLARLLSLYRDVEVWFVSPPELRMKKDVLAQLTERQTRFHVTADTDGVLERVDFIYLQRPQKERAKSRKQKRAYDSYPQYSINQARFSVIQERGIKIMHPLPRNSELPEFVDHYPGALYIREQMSNGLLIRMACIDWCFGGF